MNTQHALRTCITLAVASFAIIAAAFTASWDARENRTLYIGGASGVTLLSETLAAIQYDQSPGDQCRAPLSQGRDNRHGHCQHQRQGVDL